MVAAYAADPPKAVMIPRFSPHQQPPARTSMRVDRSGHSNANFVESDTSTTGSKKVVVTNDIVEAIHYEPSNDRERTKPSNFAPPTENLTPLPNEAHV